MKVINRFLSIFGYVNPFMSGQSSPLILKASMPGMTQGTTMPMFTTAD